MFEHFKKGDIVKYDDGHTALARLETPHAGGWHASQCLGGSLFVSRFRHATPEEIEVAKRSEFYSLDLTPFEPKQGSIIQDWAAKLGLRHQGVLVSAIRGCDSVPREDASKYLVRVYRGILLRAHCGDVKKAKSFMVPFDPEQWDHSEADFLRSIDHYPNHWLLHFVHACQIVGAKHPEHEIRMHFFHLYEKVVRKFHMSPESAQTLDDRLNADEENFAKGQV